MTGNRTNSHRFRRNGDGRPCRSGGRASCGMFGIWVGLAGQALGHPGDILSLFLLCGCRESLSSRRSTSSVLGFCVGSAVAEQHSTDIHDEVDGSPVIGGQSEMLRIGRDAESVG